MAYPFHVNFTVSKNIAKIIERWGKLIGSRFDRAEYQAWHQLFPPRPRNKKRHGGPVRGFASKSRRTRDGSRGKFQFPSASSISSFASPKQGCFTFSICLGSTPSPRGSVYTPSPPPFSSASSFLCRSKCARGSTLFYGFIFFHEP